MLPHLSRRTARWFAPSALLLLGLTGCGHHGAPVPLAAIPTIASLHDLMEDQEQTAEPAFAMLAQPTFSDADFAALGPAAQRLQATAVRTRDFAPKFSKPDAFTGFAVRLQTQAKSLEDAAAARDPSAARSALEGIRSTCNACHSQFD